MDVREERVVVRGKEEEDVPLFAHSIDLLIRQIDAAILQMERARFPVYRHRQYWLRVVEQIEGAIMPFTKQHLELWMQGQDLPRHERRTMRSALDLFDSLIDEGVAIVRRGRAYWDLDDTYESYTEVLMLDLLISRMEGDALAAQGVRSMIRMHEEEYGRYTPIGKATAWERGLSGAAFAQEPDHN